MVQVKDWDLMPPDDHIGQTNIDLEARWASQRRAACALPPFYARFRQPRRDPGKLLLPCRRGVGAWRDWELPSAILSRFCREEGRAAPICPYPPNGGPAGWGMRRWICERRWGFRGGGKLGSG